MRHLVSARSEQFTESVIREMTRLALQHEAINLAQGFPDYDPPTAMLEAAIAAIRGGVNQYGITWGAKNLRNAIAAKVAWFPGLTIDPETEITVTCGSTEAMIASLLAIINPGDEVIVFEPFYENYGPDTILSNATPRFVTLHPPDAADGDWHFDRDHLAAAFNSHTKAIILNTPNNPTGKVFTRDELTFIAELCQRWDAVAVTDEIYEHLVYDGRTHVSLATLPGMRERTITINAISKTYAATGWRVGWAIAPLEITAAIRKVHDFLTVGAPHPLQEAAVAALGLPDSYYHEMCADYCQRREFLVPALARAGFQCWAPRGAYYVMTDFSAVAIRNSQFAIRNDVDFARWLCAEVGIAAVPGSSFYHEPGQGRTQIRFSFGRSLPMLEQAVARLQRINLATQEIT